MPFLPSGRTLFVSPILSYCSSHTSRICTLLPPSVLPSIFVGFGMSVIWVHSGYCLSGRLSSRTSFWFNSMVCIWTRQTSVNMVTTESSSSAVEIIIALFDSPTFSEITATFILWVFTVYCLYLLKHSLDSSFFFFFQISLLLNVAHLHTYKILLTLMNLVAISYDNFSVSLLIPELWGACTLAFIVRQTWARVLNCTFQNLIMLWFLVFFPFPTLWKQKQS